MNFDLNLTTTHYHKLVRFKYIYCCQIDLNLAIRNPEYFAFIISFHFPAFTFSRSMFSAGFVVHIKSEMKVNANQWDTHNVWRCMRDIRLTCLSRKHFITSQYHFLSFLPFQFEMHDGHGWQQSVSSKVSRHSYYHKLSVMVINLQTASLYIHTHTDTERRNRLQYSVNLLIYAF